MFFKREKDDNWELPRDLDNKKVTDYLNNSRGTEVVEIET